MKKLLLFFALTAPLFASCPTGTIAVTDTLYGVDGLVWNGTISYKLTYNTTAAGRTFVGQLRTLKITSGVLDICLTPGSYEVNKTTTATVTAASYSVASNWVIPTTGGPYSLSDVPASVVNTSGTAVTWASGVTFASVAAKDTVLVNGTAATVSRVTSSTALVLTASVGTQTGVSFSDGAIERTIATPYYATISGPPGPAPSGTGVVQVTDGVAGLVSGTASDCVKVDGSSGACGSGTGTVTSVTADAPLTGGPITSSGHIGIPQSTSLVDGYLSHTDWSAWRTPSLMASQHWFVEANASFSAGTFERDLAIDRESNLWVANQTTPGTVTKLSPVTGSVIGTYPVGNNPEGVCTYGAYVWVVNNSDVTISKMNLDGSVVGTYSTGTAARSCIANDTSVWVSNSAAGTVTRLLAADGSVTATITTGTSPWHMVFDPTGANIWAVLLNTSNVVKISVATNSVVGTYSTTGTPKGGCTDGMNMWFGNGQTAGQGTVSVLSASTGATLATINVPTLNPQACVFDGAYIWVMHHNQGQAITQISAATWAVVGTYPLAGSDMRTMITDGVNLLATDEALNVVHKIVPTPRLGSLGYVPLAPSNNLSEVSSTSTARSNLGLGSAATLNVGTSTGTVAAGDDSRFSNARTPTAHAASHQNGGSDEIATATPGANAIPKAGAGGTLASGWIPTSGTGLLRNNLAASELSGDATTSGSNAVTVTKINGTSLAGLATGILKNTTGTGVPSIAVAADFPTLNQNTTGNAATATALAANPTDCSAGQYATTIAANGNLTCAQVSYSQVSGTPTLATVATSGSASDLTTGTLAAARGGAGTISGALKGNGSGVVSQAACADLSNAAASCSTDATNAANIGSGTLPSARLATPIRAGGFSVMFRGSDAAAGTTLYVTIPYACTITDWAITGDSTATIKLWRVADGGTALPTVSDTLSTSGFPLATGTRIHSTTLTDLSSTAIAAYDTFGINLFASASTSVEFTLGCQR